MKKRIRKVDTNGVIITVAGGGSSGDGGVATNAALSLEDVTLDSAGNLFIADTFNQRIRKVAAPSTLVLNGISTNNAGSYFVVITSSSGSVTSSIVTLTVEISPTIIAPTMLANGQFQFSFDTTTGLNYAVQYSTNLVQWLSFVTVGGVGMPIKIIDPNAAASQRRFYRINLSPQ